MITERELTDEEREELVEAAAAVELDLDGLGELGELDEEAAFFVGAWLGEQVRAATGWRWVQLTLGVGLETPALVPEDRSVALLPLELVSSGSDVRTILERLRAGQRPRGEAGSYALVG